MDHDEDYALALKLQAEFDAANNVNVNDIANAADNKPSDHHDHGDGKTHIKNGILQRPSTSSNSNYGDSSKWSLVDERWEIIDPIPDIRALFLEFNEKYFWGKLAGIEVRWSPRMTLCAGLCVYQGRAGYCSVRLSEPLLKLRPRKDLIETLLHEMIHAYLFVTDNNKDHDGHGPEFHKHMYRLNAECGTNISVYHTFHDEVDNYRQHWWKCDGPCQKKPPYFGLVKRAMNRAPSPRDPWWGQHQQTCGGSYTKIKEPEGYKDKKNKESATEKEKKVDVKPKGNMDIRDFGSKGKSSDPGTREVKPTSWDRESDSGAGPSGSTSSGSKSGTPAGPEKKQGSSSGSNSNIHGFGGKNSDETKNLHGNIHGFGASDAGEDGAGSKKPTFTGQGKTLGAAGSSGLPNGPIVRRIPGIGIITTERPTSLNGATSAHHATQDQGLCNVEGDKDDDELAQAEPSLTLGEGTSGNGAIVIDYESDESDFDVALDRILKKDSERVLKKKKSESNLGPGSSKRHKGFTSVSNPRRHSDPGRWKKSENDPPYKVGDILDRPPVKPPMKRKFFDGESRAVDRNKRACYITSSESDSDMNEGATLGSVRKNRKNYAQVESDGESTSNDSDSMDRTMTGASVGRILSDSEDSVSNVASSDVVTLDNSPPRGAVGGNVAGALRECPVCFSEVPEAQINEHLDVCLSGGGWE